MPAKHEQLTLREARKRISKILAAGETVTIAKPYENIRGFIVGVPQHERWNQADRQKALKEAKARFTAAWIATTDK